MLDIIVSFTVGTAIGAFPLGKGKLKGQYALLIVFLMGCFFGYEVLNIVPVQYTSVNTLLASANPQLQILIATGQVKTLSDLVNYTHQTVWMLVVFDGFAALLGAFVALYAQKRRSKT